VRDQGVTSFFCLGAGGSIVLYIHIKWSQKMHAKQASYKDSQDVCNPNCGFSAKPRCTNRRRMKITLLQEVWTTPMADLHKSNLHDIKPNSKQKVYFYWKINKKKIARLHQAECTFPSAGMYRYSPKTPRYAAVELDLWSWPEKLISKDCTVLISQSIG